MTLPPLGAFSTNRPTPRLFTFKGFRGLTLSNIKITVNIDVDFNEGQNDNGIYTPKTTVTTPTPISLVQMCQLTRDISCCPMVIKVIINDR